MLYNLFFSLANVPREKREAARAEIKSTPAFYKWALLGLIVGPQLAIDGFARAEAPNWTMVVVLCVAVAGSGALVIHYLERKGIPWRPCDGDAKSLVQKLSEARFGR